MGDYGYKIVRRAGGAGSRLSPGNALQDRNAEWSRAAAASAVVRKAGKLVEFKHTPLQLQSRKPLPLLQLLPLHILKAID